MLVISPLFSTDLEMLVFSFLVNLNGLHSLIVVLKSWVVVEVFQAGSSSFLWDLLLRSNKVEMQLCEGIRH